MMRPQQAEPGVKKINKKAVIVRDKTGEEAQEGKQLTQGHPWASSRTRNETQVSRGPGTVPTPMGATRCCPRAGAARRTAGFPKSPVPSGAPPWVVGLLCTWGRGVQGIWGLCSPSRATQPGCECCWVDWGRWGMLADKAEWQKHCLDFGAYLQS